MIIIEPHCHMISRAIMYDNPLAFYSQTPKFQPRLDLPSIDPATYQR